MFRFEEGNVSVGDTVMWRGGWGEDPAKPAVVEGIEINTRGGKDGDPVNTAPWSAMTRENAILSLNNGHWCYGDAIGKLNNQPFFRSKHD
jgi:hypothetical protein